MNDIHPDGTLVTYHGSLSEFHGVLFRTEFRFWDDDPRYLQARYTLLPVDQPEGRILYNARHGSLRVAENRPQ